MHRDAAGIGKKSKRIIRSMKVGHGQNSQDPQPSSHTAASVHIGAEGFGSSQPIRPDLMHGPATKNLGYSLAEVRVANRLIDGAATVATNTTKVNSPTTIAYIRPTTIYAGASTSIMFKGTVAAGDMVRWAINCSKPAEAEIEYDPTDGKDMASFFKITSPGTYKLCYRGSCDSCDWVAQKSITLKVQESAFGQEKNSLIYIGIGVGIAVAAGLVTALTIVFGLGTGESQRT